MCIYRFTATLVYPRIVLHESSVPISRVKSSHAAVALNHPPQKRTAAPLYLSWKGRAWK